jgi:hypothetical protein
MIDASKANFSDPIMKPAFDDDNQVDAIRNKIMELVKQC